jgi:hypothetical protein
LYLAGGFQLLHKCFVPEQFTGSAHPTSLRREGELKMDQKMDQARFHRNGKSDFDDLGLVLTGRTRATNLANKF